MYLLGFFMLFFSVVFLLRSFMVWKKTKVNPLVFKREDDAHGYNGKVFVLISLLELTLLVLHAFFPKVGKYFMSMWYLENELLVLVGWTILWISFLLVVIAQSNMGESWRIGIDDTNRSALVTKGIFAFSRNPVFLCIIIANLGLFLVLPNAFTLLIFVVSVLSMNTQVRLEEAYLQEEFGNEYLKYRSSVNRWITINLKSDG